MQRLGRAKQRADFVLPDLSHEQHDHHKEDDPRDAEGAGDDAGDEIDRDLEVEEAADEVGEKVPMILGLIVFLVIGEVLRIVSAKDRKEEYKGLTPELAAQRLAEEVAAEQE